MDESGGLIETTADAPECDRPVVRSVNRRGAQSSSDVQIDWADVLFDLISGPQPALDSLLREKIGFSPTVAMYQRIASLTRLCSGPDSPTEVLSVSLPGNLKTAVQEVAGKQGVSAFVSSAIRNELAKRARADFVAAVEAQSGALTQDDLAKAEALLAE